MGAQQGVTRANAALRLWRERKGMTQAELAALVRCSRTLICMVELGNRSPGLSLAKRLALLTGLPLEAF